MSSHKTCMALVNALVLIFIVSFEIIVVQPDFSLSFYTTSNSRMSERQQIGLPAEYEAPEVFRPHGDGLEVFNAHNDAPIPVQDRGGTDKFYQHNDNYAGGAVATPSSKLGGSTEHKLRRQRPWFQVLSSMIVLIIGLGAGIGIGYAVPKSKSNSKTDASTATTCSDLSPISTGTATSSGVTSGTTGFTALECNSTVSDNTYTTTTNPTTFTEECYVDYSSESSTRAYGTTTNETVEELTKSTMYTFQACMEQCAIYNENLGDSQKCLAVTYATNLTRFLAEHGGNCFLKDHRGDVTRYLDLYGEFWYSNTAASAWVD